MYPILSGNSSSIQVGDDMERLTEPYGNDCFRMCGNKTVYNRNPKKSNRVVFALAKLFHMEELTEPKKIVCKDGFYGGYACLPCGEIFTIARSPRCTYCGQAINCVTYKMVGV